MRIKTGLYEELIKSKDLQKQAEFKSFRHRLNADLRRAKRVYSVQQLGSE